MSETTRRGFLGVAGAGAAAVGAVAITPGSAFAGETQQKENGAKESVVAYIKDHKADSMTLMVGEREVVVHDRDLVNRILNAAGK
jgi:hypothetical protein